MDAAVGGAGSVAAAEIEALAERSERSAAALAELRAADQDLAAALEAAAEQVAAAAAAAESAAIAAAGPVFSGEILLRDDSVTFAPGSAELSPEARRMLDAFAEQLAIRDADVHVEIEGHADPTGDAASNRLLSRARAEAARRYLGGRGVPLPRMGVVAQGAEDPLGDNTTAEGRTANRRVTLVVRSN